MGWDGVGMLTFLALAHMVDATQLMGLVWGGVGMVTFLALAHMVYMLRRSFSGRSSTVYSVAKLELLVQY